MGIAIDAAEEYSPDPPRRGVRPMRLALACIALDPLQEPLDLEEP